MSKLLLSGDVRFFMEPEEKQYARVLAIAKDDEFGLYQHKAKALIARAQRKEPMNFDLEARKLYMEVVHALLRQSEKHSQ